MNYIDPSLDSVQVLPLNANCEVTDTVSWTLQKEGNDANAITFSSPSANFAMADMKYFQAFPRNFFAEGIDLDPESFYVLKGAVNGSEVYVGKVFVTEQDLGDYSNNKNQYTHKSSTNNFVILN